MINVLKSSFCFSECEAPRRLPLFGRAPDDGFAIASIVVPAKCDYVFESREGCSRVVFFVDGLVNVTSGTQQYRLSALTAIELDAALPLNISSGAAERALCLEVLSPFSTQVPVAAPRIIPVDIEKFYPQLGERYTSSAYNVQTISDREVGLSNSRIFVAKIDPNTGLNRHIHPFDQFYLILKGRLSLEVGIAQAVAEVGDFVVLPAGTVHRNWNDTTDAILEVTIFDPQPEPGNRLTYPVSVEF